MFENFSFSAPLADRPGCLTVDGDDRIMVDCDSSMISPLSSRSPSPSCVPSRSRPLTQSHSSYLRRPQPPTSIPSSYERYCRRISVSTLTEKLNAHTLGGDSSDVDGQRRDDQFRPPLSPVSPLSPKSPGPRSAYAAYGLPIPAEEDEDEGYYESAYSSSSRAHSLYPTSVPSARYHQDRGSVSSPLSDDRFSDYRDERQRIVRLYRQRLSRAQCSAPAGIDAIRLALLAEENERRTLDAGNDCHPSSLPPELSPPRRRASILSRTSATRNRQVSGSGLGSGSGSGSGLDSRERSPLESTARRKSASAASFSVGSKVGKSRSHHHHHHNHHQSPSARDLFLRKMRSEQTFRRKSHVNAALTSMMFETPVSSPGSNSS
ncbi:hypothetical protein VTN77DRAFT_503 [Rasamsonia byssochlamydoides]|uniref:uncharacterized protein n=1 Tax=Rasamsonia byssochlamydoides TaxID=89139 RepID=UPI0037442972